MDFDTIQPGKLTDYGIINPEKLRSLSATSGGIRGSVTFDVYGQPQYYGHLDCRQGPVNWSSKCQTCSGNMIECPGHFGHIELAKPIIRIRFLHWIIRILGSVCFVCSKLLVSLTDPRMQEIHANTGLDQDQRMLLVYNLCKNINVCNNPDPSNKLEAYGNHNQSCNTCQPKIWRSGFELIVQWKYVNDEKITLSAEQLLNILKHISDEEYIAMGFNLEVAHPLWFVLTVLPMPPLTGHPAIIMSTLKKNHNDLIVKLCTVLNCNDDVSRNLENGAPEHIITQSVKCLQFHIASLFNDFPSIQGSLNSSYNSENPLHDSPYPPTFYGLCSTTTETTVSVTENSISSYNEIW